ncbi:hypothetical protein P280DRAFT_220140 [Massarina eburnea CBS 473.64]|uniref:Uncharacterized protein n=1 Tax=Massarina eburnea CBS 473.64 TaxID=1395130 RepID=A0A6A6S841_9PLEO|nr:hypothetical protein P280DRAFT_220140 [Massarina eburnea CBS 473.64]
MAPAPTLTKDQLQFAKGPAPTPSSTHSSFPHSTASTVCRVLEPLHHPHQPAATRCTSITLENCLAEQLLLPAHTLSTSRDRVHRTCTPAALQAKDQQSALPLWWPCASGVRVPSIPPPAAYCMTLLSPGTCVARPCMVHLLQPSICRLHKTL